MQDDEIHIGLGKTKAGKEIYLYPAMANRHGIIAGATGTGKTVSLQVLAEAFSNLGVPVFTADIKGDLSGLSEPIAVNEKLQKRFDILGIQNFIPSSSPTVFWDVFGKNGHPLRATISEIGPILFSHMLELNETQSDVLQVCFKVADDQGLLLLDLKDVQALLKWVGENRAEISNQYGNVASATVAAITRRLLVMEEAGGGSFFGEPGFDLNQLLKTDFSGKGLINILDATDLVNSPRLYSSFLLWLLSELYEQLEERGDSKLPRLVFFFDEAHLLFDNATKTLLDKIEQVVRLIRSKGIGIYFVTQHPCDVPESVLSQLGHRLIHSLRAYTPKEQKLVKTAAQSFRVNPEFDTMERLTNLGVGECLVSVLDPEGKPTIVEEVIMNPPHSKIGAISPEQRKVIIERSPLFGVYEKVLDRESAFEELQKRAAQKVGEPEKKNSSRQGFFETMVKSVLRTIGTQLGRQIVRGILGSMGK